MDLHSFWFSEPYNTSSEDRDPSTVILQTVGFFFFSQLLFVDLKELSFGVNGSQSKKKIKKIRTDSPINSIGRNHFQNEWNHKASWFILLFLGKVTLQVTKSNVFIEYSCFMEGSAGTFSQIKKNIVDINLYSNAIPVFQSQVLVCFRCWTIKGFLFVCFLTQK